MMQSWRSWPTHYIWHITCHNFLRTLTWGTWWKNITISGHLQIWDANHHCLLSNKHYKMITDVKKKKHKNSCFWPLGSISRTISNITNHNFLFYLLNLSLIFWIWTLCSGNKRWIYRIMRITFTITATCSSSHWSDQYFPVLFGTSLLSALLGTFWFFSSVHHWFWIFLQI